MVILLQKKSFMTFEAFYFKCLPKINKNTFSSLFKESMARRTTVWQRKLNEMKSLHGEKELAKIKVGQILKGMEGLSTMFYTASILHPKMVNLSSF